MQSTLLEEEMKITQDEAEESLADIQRTTQRTRRSITGSGAHIFLIITGAIWLVGFLATQYLTGNIVPTIWIAASLIGSALAILLGTRMSKRVRGPSTPVYAARIGTFWLVLILFAIAIIAVARPTDAKQLTLIIILFAMLGQFAMGLLLSFTSTWWALPISALALIGYFLLPEFFYLWMGVLVGGAMVGLGTYILLRW
jgi:hypothetical protein